MNYQPNLTLEKVLMKTANQNRVAIVTGGASGHRMGNHRTVIHDKILTVIVGDQQKLKTAQENLEIMCSGILRSQRSVGYTGNDQI